MVEKMVEKILKSKNKVKDIDEMFNTRKIFAGEFYFKACNTHIFGNSFPSFVPDVIHEHGMHKGDHVHVFIDQIYLPIKMDALVSALRKCYNITGRKIMIYIPDYSQIRHLIDEGIKERVYCSEDDVDTNNYESLKYDVIPMRKPVNFVYKYKGWADRWRMTKYISIYTYENTLVAKRSNIHH